MPACQAPYTEETSDASVCTASRSADWSQFAAKLGDDNAVLAMGTQGALGVIPV
jgi:hypothetical protein